MRLKMAGHSNPVQPSKISKNETRQRRRATGYQNKLDLPSKFSAEASQKLLSKYVQKSKKENSEMKARLSELENKISSKSMTALTANGAEEIDDMAEVTKAVPSPKIDTEHSHHLYDPQKSDLSRQIQEAKDKHEFENQKLELDQLKRSLELQKKDAENAMRSMEESIFLKQIRRETEQLQQLASFIDESLRRMNQRH